MTNRVTSAGLIAGPNRRRVLAFLSSLPILSGRAAADDPKPPVEVTPLQMFEAINALRIRNGGNRIAFSPLLTRLAHNQAYAMLQHDQMSHDFGPAQDLISRAARAGWHRPIGENVAAGQSSLTEAIDDWVASESHRSTMLAKIWTVGGMAMIQDRRPQSFYGTFWAAEFGLG